MTGLIVFMADPNNKHDEDIADAPIVTGCVAIIAAAFFASAVAMLILQHFARKASRTAAVLSLVTACVDGLVMALCVATFLLSLFTEDAKFLPVCCASLFFLVFVVADILQAACCIPFLRSSNV